MANIKMLIRIVFVIFIANGIDCLGSVCDNCCNCFKEKDENEEIAISLVNKGWYKSKNNLVLMIFEKGKNDVFTPTEKEDQISFQLDENDNSKIACQNYTKNKLKLWEKKYALFKIKTQEEETVYLYCSDVESNWLWYGIFNNKKHKSISVIACDTENVTNMRSMFSFCSSLTELDLLNFNTKNVTAMTCMFSKCSSLKELDLKNFDTSNVTDMVGMFSGCSSLENLNISNFNTSNVTSMFGMFSGCSSLKELDLKNFDTSNVADMVGMFSGCSSLEKLDLKKFHTENVTETFYMFSNCNSLQTVTFNKNLNNKIIQQLEILGLTEKVVEEGNIITLEKTTNLVFQ